MACTGPALVRTNGKLYESSSGDWARSGDPLDIAVHSSPAGFQDSCTLHVGSSIALDLNEQTGASPNQSVSEGTERISDD